MCIICQLFNESSLRFFVNPQTFMTFSGYIRF